MLFGGARKVLELSDAHYSKVVECYTGFTRFIEAYFNNDEEQILACYKFIHKCENEADDFKSDVVDHLMTGALLPSTRKEILDLCGLLDKIANRAQDISRQIVIEKVVLPEQMRQEFLDIVHLTQEQLIELTSVIELLFDDYERLVKDPSKLEKIRELESAVDKIENDLIQRTFAMDIHLAEKNHIKYFIRHISNVSDHIENIGDKIQIMMIYRKV